MIWVLGTQVTNKDMLTYEYSLATAEGVDDSPVGMVVTLSLIHIYRLYLRVEYPTLQKRICAFRREWLLFLHFPMKVYLSDTLDSWCHLLDCRYLALIHQL